MIESIFQNSANKWSFMRNKLLSIGNKLLNKGMRKHSISWATTITIMVEIATKIERRLNGTARPPNRDMLRLSMNLVPCMAMD